MHLMLFRSVTDGLTIHLCIHLYVLFYPSFNLFFVFLSIYLQILNINSIYVSIYLSIDDYIIPKIESAQWVTYPIDYHKSFYRTGMNCSANCVYDENIHHYLTIIV